MSAALPLEHALAEAIVLHNRGRAADAEAACRRLLEQAPGHPAVEQLLGVLCLERGDAAAALEHLQRSLAVRGDHLPSLLSAVRAAWATGSAEKVRSFAQRAVAGHPSSAPAWYELGRAQHALGARSDAAAAFERAAILQPTLVPAWFALSLVYEDLHRPADARQALEHVRRLQPDHAQAAVNLGLLLQESGDIDAALACYADAYRLQPDSFGRIAHALCAKPHGRLWLDLDDLRRALRSLSEAPRA